MSTTPVDDAPLNRLLSALPKPVGRMLQGLRRPGLIWVRLPLGVLFVIGSIGFMLPLLGLWMLPVGLILLSEDIPSLKRPTLGGLARVQSWYDRARERTMDRRGARHRRSAHVRSSGRQARNG